MPADFLSAPLAEVLIPLLLYFVATALTSTTQPPRRAVTPPQEDRGYANTPSNDQYDITFLRLNMNRTYSLDDLRTLAVDLGLTLDDLGGESKEAKIRELILFLKNRGSLPKLIDRLTQERPHINWRAAISKSLPDKQDDLTPSPQPSDATLTSPDPREYWRAGISMCVTGMAINFALFINRSMLSARSSSEIQDTFMRVSGVQVLLIAIVTYLARVDQSRTVQRLFIMWLLGIVAISSALFYWR